ncbi:unnamed protein product [Rhodiola kirilowii]
MANKSGVHSVLLYGGSATLPSYSPHLRISGSRAVFVDPSSHEVGNSSEEGFPLSAEADEMKGSITPLSAATIVSSPVLLWRSKKHAKWLQHQDLAPETGTT